MSDDTEKLKAGLLAVAELMDNSTGVTGLHLNGDVASWGELREGGRFEEWLIAFDEALELCRIMSSVQSLRQALAKPTWRCPLKNPDCKENCGNYGCGN